MAADKKRRKKRTDEKPIREELLDELLADYEKPEDVIGENGLLKRLTKRVLERAMNVELADHLGYEKHDPAGYHSGNSRNGTTGKTLKGNFGALELETPRDRSGTFEPKIVAKGQTRFTGFDDKIISLYARGMSTREYQVEYSRNLLFELGGRMERVFQALIDRSRAPKGSPQNNFYHFGVRNAGESARCYIDELSANRIESGAHTRLDQDVTRLRSRRNKSLPAANQRTPAQASNRPTKRMISTSFPDEFMPEWNYTILPRTKK